MGSSNDRHRAHSSSHLNEARDYWWNEDFLGLLADRLDLARVQAMADIGCGKGMMAFRLAPYLSPGAAIFGLDQEARYIKAAQKAASKFSDSNRFHFSTGDAYALPWADQQMDLSLCQTLLIHLENPAAAIEEMKRITRPGGCILALEPNNLVQQLMFDRYQETDFRVEEVLQVMEVRLRMEQGKKMLGKGYSSLGDVVPDLFQQAGLENIQVWLSDKALQIIPPYDTKEKRVRVAQLVSWLEEGNGGLGYEENLNYYLAGGGKKADFQRYWQRVLAYKDLLLQKISDQEHISAGGGVMYIVAGWLPEE